MYPLTFLLISLCSPYPIIATGHWCYDSQSAKCGPSTWKNDNHICGMKKQSPINIVTKKAQFDGALSPIIFNGYDKTGRKWEMQNNGHSLQVKLQGDITIKGGNLPNTYKAVQFHFHWGTDSHPGSEHTIDGEQYPMELHIVHQNEKYTSFSEALNYDDGLAVLGFLFEESSEKNSKITDFIDMLKYVPYPGNKTWLEPFPLSKIIPDEELHKYYRYRGSLTTPTCNQVVIWTVFEETIPISKSQLNAFSENLYFSDSKHMKLNFRPVQNLNDRAVYVTGSAVRLFSAVGLSVGLAVWTSIFN